jgi:hypothetical protein
MNKTHNIYQLIAGSFSTAPLSLALTVLALCKERADGIVALLQHATGVVSAHVFIAIPSGVFCLAHALEAVGTQRVFTSLQLAVSVYDVARWLAHTLN